MNSCANNCLLLIVKFLCSDSIATLKSTHQKWFHLVSTNQTKILFYPSGWKSIQNPCSLGIPDAQIGPINCAYFHERKRFVFLFRTTSLFNRHWRTQLLHYVHTTLHLKKRSSFTCAKIATNVVLFRNRGFQCKFYRNTQRYEYSTLNPFDAARELPVIPDFNPISMNLFLFRGFEAKQLYGVFIDPQRQEVRIMCYKIQDIVYVVPKDQFLDSFIFPSDIPTSLFECLDAFRTKTHYLFLFKDKLETVKIFYLMIFSIQMKTSQWKSFPYEPALVTSISLHVFYHEFVLIHVSNHFWMVCDMNAKVLNSAFYPPSSSEERCLVKSTDGNVYCLSWTKSNLPKKKKTKKKNSMSSAYAYQSRKRKLTQTFKEQQSREYQSFFPLKFVTLKKLV